jgi:hypothetical protein
VSASNADSISDLAGLFTNMSLGGGWGPHATGDAFFDPKGNIAGGGFTAGLGVGAGAFLGPTDTAILPWWSPEPKPAPCEK